jgi:hypothetical protein
MTPLQPAFAQNEPLISIRIGADLMLIEGYARSPAMVSLSDQTLADLAAGRVSAPQFTTNTAFHCGARYFANTEAGTASRKSPSTCGHAWPAPYNSTMPLAVVCPLA